MMELVIMYGGGIGVEQNKVKRDDKIYIEQQEIYK